HVHAVAAAHLEVAQDDVVLPFVQLLDGDVAVRRLVDLVMRVRQRAHDAAPKRVVIVGYQNATHTDAPTSLFFVLPPKGGSHSVQQRAARSRPPNYRNSSWLPLTGSVTLKRVPPSAGALTSMRPSCASTIFRTIARPKPEPCGFVVKNGLKIRSIRSAGTPGPLSPTST